jgi:hypothetical protein
VSPTLDRLASDNITACCSAPASTIAGGSNEGHGSDQRLTWRAYFSTWQVAPFTGPRDMIGCPKKEKPSRRMVGTGSKKARSASGLKGSLILRERVHFPEGHGQQGPTKGDRHPRSYQGCGAELIPERLPNGGNHKNSS